MGAGMYGSEEGDMLFDDEFGDDTAAVEFDESEDALDPNMFDSMLEDSMMDDEDQE